LSNGRGTRPVGALDLCRRHSRRILRLFNPGIPEASKPSARHMTKGAVLEPKILAVLKDRKQHTTAEIAEQIGVKRNAVFYRLTVLRDQKKIKSEGRGTKTRYSMR
jgi:predicted HTH transcriptional regulator